MQSVVVVPFGFGEVSRKIIPAPWPILHTARSVDEFLRDEHGNDITVDAAPVVRYVISYSQFEYKGPLSSLRVYSSEYIDQNSTSLHLTIPHEDIGYYSSGDQVLVGGTVAVDGSYVGGLAFLLDGEVGSDMQGPWPKLYKHFGGIVKIRRIG